MTDEWSDERWDAASAAIRSAAHALLAHGPMALDELTASLDQQGAFAEFDGCGIDELREVVDEALVETDDTWTSSSGAICLTSALLHGVVMTHRVSAGELERGVLDTTPDLGTVTWGTQREWTLAGGGRVTHEFPLAGETQLDEHGSYLGPDGWLDGITPGQLIGVTLDDEQVTVVREVTPSSVDGEAASLREAFEAMCDDAFVVEIDQLVLELLLRDPRVFRTPTVPVGDLIDRAGLRLRGAWVGRADHDFATPGEQYRRDLLDRLTSDYRLDECCRAALERLIAHWAGFVLAVPERRLELADTWNPRVLFDDFYHGSVTPALVDYIWDRHNHRVELLDEFAAALAMFEPLEPSALYLVADNAVRGGVADEALRAMQRATSFDGVPGPVLELHATLLADAGRAAEALSALRRAAEFGAPEHEIAFLTDLLRSFLAAGRNDPCPCGSGRKYKQCCQQEPKLSQLERRRLAMHQATRSLYEPRHREILFSLAMDTIEASGAPPDELTRRVGRLISDPFIVDLALFDDGGIAGYLNERHAIVPPAELTWLRSLAGSRRSLWEYQLVDGDQFDVRDVVSGDSAGPITLDAQAFGGGGQMLARVVDDSLTGTVGVLGPVHGIEPPQRAGLVDLLEAGADAHELAAWYGVQTAPRRQQRAGE